MEYVSPILEIANCLWPSTSERAAYLRNMKENLGSLESKMIQLKNLREDVKTMVELEESQQQMKRTNQVDGWLSKVQEVEVEAAQVLQQGKEEDGRKCFGGCCPKNCRSSYKVGKKVSKMIAEVDELCSEGSFNVLVNRLPRAPVDEMPMGKIVGLDLMLEKVWKIIEDRSVGIIGLFGIGGVGKTTLLKRINNEFYNRSQDFELVIWAVVSKQVNVEKIQEVIRNKLGISDTTWTCRNEDEKAAEIYKILRTKKFVLLLDDIWQRFDLSKVGVPVPDNENESKVIFTTRSEEVCGYMEADRQIKVECLARDEALNLFKKTVGNDTLHSHQEIPELAEIVADKCKGLPLALITIGRAMATRRNPREWKHVIKTLHSYPDKFPGMGDHVFPILKFSYDSLSNDTTKLCFLYCSLFPEDDYIEKDDLIQLWIGEGILDKFNDIHDARNEGEYIIGSLKLACLLESVELENYTGEQVDFVRMHDVIRDMALWLACDHGEKESKILVHEHPGLIRGKWEEVERMSLWRYPIQLSNGMPMFPNLQSFWLRDSPITTFPSGFLLHMPLLIGLDLSYNHYLADLPAGIGELINLLYLNLSWTAIIQIPIEIKYLKKLRTLIMDNTKCLGVIPREVIPSLSSLQVFSKIAIWDFLYDDEQFDEMALLVDLERSEQINDIAINLTTIASVEKFLNSPVLQRCIRRLILMECSDMTEFNVSSLSLTRMEHLEMLDIRFCQSLSDFKVHQEEDKDRMQGFISHLDSINFRSLRFVHIRCCPMKDFTWLAYAPSLQTLQLHNCPSVEEVISDTCASAVSNLTELSLILLPNLSCICKQALPFPSLAKIYISGCPRLKKLPLDLSSASNSLKVIKGERSWWDVLEWECEDAKNVFSSKFVDWEYHIQLSL